MSASQTTSIEDVNKRRTKQAVFFLLTGGISIFAAVTAKRSIMTRRYVPTLFEANNRPPSFNLVKDAAQAVSQASLLAVSSFAFAIASIGWATDVSSLGEFSHMMKNKFGAAKKEAIYLNAPPDLETEQFTQSLEQAIGGTK